MYVLGDNRLREEDLRARSHPAKLRSRHDATHFLLQETKLNRSPEFKVSLGYSKF